MQLGTPALILDVELPDGGGVTTPVPPDFQGFAYLLEGEAAFGANRRRARPPQLVLLGPGERSASPRPPQEHGSCSWRGGRTERNPCSTGRTWTRRQERAPKNGHMLTSVRRRTPRGPRIILAFCMTSSNVQSPQYRIREACRARRTCSARAPTPPRVHARSDLNERARLMMTPPNRSGDAAGSSSPSGCWRRSSWPTSRLLLDRQRDVPGVRPVGLHVVGGEGRRLPPRSLAVGKPTKVTNSIRSLRFTHGEMTQADLADRIGVTRQTIIAIEQGRYSPSPRGGVPDRAGVRGPARRGVPVPRRRGIGLTNQGDVAERYLESSRTTFSRFARHTFSGVGGRMSSQIAAKLPSSCGIRAGRAMNHQCRCSEPSPHRQT